MHNRREISSLNMLFRLKQIAPRYLLEVIPATRHEIITCNLRNSNNISLPSNRLSSFRNSFIPGTIRRWNRLPEAIKTTTCNRSFKQAVAQMYNVSKVPIYYMLGNKIDTILHTRLRIGLSTLNAHLFRIDSPQVDSPYCTCAQVPETVKHFFLVCPHHVIPRQELERQLKRLIVGYDRMSVDDKLALFLCGRNLGTAADLAVALALVVHKFIRNTNRFCI